MALPKREAGVLCHISSLPNEYGIGTLGKEAYEFAKKLAANGICECPNCGRLVYKA